MAYGKLKPVPVQQVSLRGFPHSGQHMKVTGNRGPEETIGFAAWLSTQLAHGSHRHGTAVLCPTVAMAVEVPLGFASHLTVTVFALLRSVLMLPPQLCRWLK